MRCLKCIAVILLAAPIFGSDGNPSQPKPNLTVHEWGTFTTVANATGGSEAWNPLGGPSDLPCFVLHLHGRQYKVVSQSPYGPTSPSGPTNETVMVRMETPVLYFYSSRKTTVSVGVDFPKGLITEWYPGASKVLPVPDTTLPPVQNGHIDWAQLEINPGENPALPTGNAASHYYAARNTDADPVSIGSQQEKMLFYRGVANFDVPVRARFVGDKIVELSSTGDEPVVRPILFENRGGHIGFRILKGVRGRLEYATPELGGSLNELKQVLSDMLVSQGLYRKEADAMIETWRDSWFEEGMRVFYLVPRKMVDRELPLTVQPAPTDIQRVFVGRVELLSPYLRDRLTTALADGNTPELDRYGRFLLPFMQQLQVNAAPAVADYLAAKAKQATAEFFSPTCVR